MVLPNYIGPALKLYLAIKTDNNRIDLTPRAAQIIQTLSAVNPTNKRPRMTRIITISLPVTDLKVSKAFYTAIGFVNNPLFTDDTAALMVWSESINVMLLTHEKWRTFTTRPIPPKTSSEVALNISCDSREDVDAINKLASENGGIADINPVEDHGSMYGRDFVDPDGHVWGAMWMEMSAMPSGK